LSSLLAAKLVFCILAKLINQFKKSKGSPYSITERRVLGSQPADGMSHKPDGRLPLLSARPAVSAYPRNP